MKAYLTTTRLRGQRGAWLELPDDLDAAAALDVSDAAAEVLPQVAAADLAAGGSRDWRIGATDGADWLPTEDLEEAYEAATWYERLSGAEQVAADVLFDSSYDWRSVRTVLAGGDWRLYQYDPSRYRSFEAQYGAEAFEALEDSDVVARLRDYVDYDAYGSDLLARTSYYGDEYAHYASFVVLLA